MGVGVRLLHCLFLFWLSPVDLTMAPEFQFISTW